MRLVAEHDDNRVIVLEDFERYLSPATGGVAIGNVGAVLEAIRAAASQLKPPTYTPSELEQLTSLIFESATHLKALLAKIAADDPDAVAVLALLRALGLENPPVPEEPPLPLAPVNVEGPAISGTPRATMTLATTEGTWEGQQPITFSYRWWRCDALGTNCSAITLLAQNPTYVVKAADVGSTLRVIVTATNGSGEAKAMSERTAVITT